MATSFFNYQKQAKLRNKLFNTLFLLSLVVSFVFFTIAALFLVELFDVYFLNYLKLITGASASTDFNPSRFFQLFSPDGINLFTTEILTSGAIYLGLVIYVVVRQHSTLSAGGIALTQILQAQRRQPVKSLETQQIDNIVEEISIAAAIIPPTAYILKDEDGINAFVAGHNQYDDFTYSVYY